MLIDYDTLAPVEKPPRRRVPRPPTPAVTPHVELWDDEVLDRIERDRVEALERDEVIRSLADYEQLLAEIELVPAELVHALSNGTELFVAGRRMSRTRSGADVLVTLQDGTGTCDIVFTPDTLADGELVLVSGVADDRAVRATESWDLRELLRRYQSWTVPSASRLYGR
jgi:hypothetical protein